MLKTLQPILFVVGGVTVAKISWELSLWLYRNFIAHSELERFGAGRGAYAVITGASDGIGKGLAEEGASLGFNLVLVARNEKNLSIVAKELTKQYNVDVRFLSVDCSDKDVGKSCTIIANFCQGLDVSLLFNNVGFSNPQPMALENQDPATISNIVITNSLFLATLSATFVPILKKRVAHSKSSAAICNVSSFLSMLPACNFSVYSGTKAFVNQFSDALETELQGSGIAVICFRPAHVVSRMSGITTPSVMVPTARTYARSVWKKVGIGGIISSYPPHALQEAFAAAMPHWFLRHSLRAALVPPPVS